MIDESKDSLNDSNTGIIQSFHASGNQKNEAGESRRESMHRILDELLTDNMTDDDYDRIQAFMESWSQGRNAGTSVNSSGAEKALESSVDSVQNGNLHTNFSLDKGINPYFIQHVASIKHEIISRVRQNASKNTEKENLTEKSGIVSPSANHETAGTSPATGVTEKAVHGITGATGEVILDDASAHNASLHETDGNELEENTFKVDSTGGTSDKITAAASVGDSVPHRSDDTVTGFSSNSFSTSGNVPGGSISGYSGYSRPAKSSGSDLLEMITGKMIAGIGAAVLMIIGFIMVARSINFSFGPYGRFLAMLLFSGVMIYFGGFKASKKEKSSSIEELSLGRVILSSAGFALLYVTMAAGYVYFDIIPGGIVTWMIFLTLWSFILMHLMLKRHPVFSLISQLGVVGSIPLACHMGNYSFILICSLILFSQLPANIFSVIKRRTWSFTCGSIGFAIVTAVVAYNINFVSGSGTLLLSLFVVAVIVMQKIMLIISCYRDGDNVYKTEDSWSFNFHVAVTAGTLFFIELPFLIIVHKLFSNPLTAVMVMLASFAAMMITDEKLYCSCRKRENRFCARVAIDTILVLLIAVGVFMPDRTVMIWGLTMVYGLIFCLKAVKDVNTARISNMVRCSLLAAMFMMIVIMQHIVIINLYKELLTVAVIGGTAAIMSLAYYLYRVRTVEDRDAGYYSKVHCINRHIGMWQESVSGFDDLFIKCIGLNFFVAALFIIYYFWGTAQEGTFLSIVSKVVVLFLLGILTVLVIKRCSEDRKTSIKQEFKSVDNTGYVNNKDVNLAGVYSLSGGIFGFLLVSVGTITSFVAHMSSQFVSGSMISGHWINLDGNILTGTLLSLTFLPLLYFVYRPVFHRVKNIRLIITGISFVAVSLLAVCIENYLNWVYGLGLFAGLCGLLALKKFSRTFVTASVGDVINREAVLEDNKLFFRGLGAVSVILATCFYYFYGNYELLSDHFKNYPLVAPAVWIIYTAVFGFSYFSNVVKDLRKKITPVVITGYTVGMTVFLWMAVTNFFHTELAQICVLFPLALAVYLISRRYSLGFLNVLSVLLTVTATAFLYRNYYSGWTDSIRALVNTMLFTVVFGSWMLTYYGKVLNNAEFINRFLINFLTFIMWLAAVVAGYSVLQRETESLMEYVIPLKPEGLPLYWWIPVAGYMTFAVFKKQILPVVLAVFTMYLFIYNGWDEFWRSIANTVSYTILAASIILLVKPKHHRVYNFLLPSLLIIWECLFSLYNDKVWVLGNNSEVYWSVPVILYLAVAYVRRDLIPVLSAIMIVFYGYHSDSVFGSSMFLVFSYVITAFIMNVMLAEKYRRLYEIISLILLSGLLIYYSDVKTSGYVWILFIPALCHFLEAVITRSRFNLFKAVVLTAMGTSVIAFGYNKALSYYLMFFILPVVPVWLFVNQFVETARSRTWINLAVAGTSVYILLYVFFCYVNGDISDGELLRGFVDAPEYKKIYAGGVLNVLYEYHFFYVPVLLLILLGAVALNIKSSRLSKVSEPDWFFENPGQIWQMPVSRLKSDMQKYARVMSIFTGSVYVKFLIAVSFIFLACYLVHLVYALYLTGIDISKIDIVNSSIHSISTGERHIHADTPATSSLSSGLFGISESSIKIVLTDLSALTAVILAFVGGIFVRYGKNDSCKAAMLGVTFGGSIEEFTERGNLINRRLWYIAEITAISYVFMLTVSSDGGSNALHLLALAGSCLISVPLMFTSRDNLGWKSNYCIAKYFMFIGTMCITLDLGTLVLTVMSLVSSAVMLAVGFVYRVSYVRRAGLIICLLCTTKLIVYDIDYHSDITRALSVLFAGIVLLVISLMYNFFSRYISGTGSNRQ